MRWRGRVDDALFVASAPSAATAAFARKLHLPANTAFTAMVAIPVAALVGRGQAVEAQELLLVLVINVNLLVR